MQCFVAQSLLPTQARIEIPSQTTKEICTKCVCVPNAKAPRGGKDHSRSPHVWRDLHKMCVRTKCKSTTWREGSQSLSACMEDAVHACLWQSCWQLSLCCSRLWLRVSPSAPLLTPFHFPRSLDCCLCHAGGPCSTFVTAFFILCPTASLCVWMCVCVCVCVCTRARACVHLHQNIGKTRLTEPPNLRASEQ